MTRRSKFVGLLKKFRAASSVMSLENAHDSSHPNQMPFSGILVILDAPSTKPPHGSRGHKIYLPLSVTKKRLNTLIGTGINYDPGNLDEHMPRHKVGVITNAKIVRSSGKPAVKVSGFIWKKDFPEAERDLRKPDLGMSMELGDVYVRDEKEDVWYLTDFVFTGATILKKDAAAYYDTSLAARAAATGEGEEMKKPKSKKTQKVAASASPDQSSLVAAFTTALAEANKPLHKAIGSMSKQLSIVASSVNEQNSLLTMLASAEDESEETVVSAGADESDESIEAGADESSDESIEAGADESDESMEAAADDESDDSEGDDSTDDESMDAALEDLEDKAPHARPGEVNKGMKKKGNKTTTTDVGAEAGKGKGVFPGLVHSSGINAAAVLTIQAAERRRFDKKLQSVKAAAEKKSKKLNRRITTLQSQVERFTEMESRRSVQVLPADLVNLAAKANVNLREMYASGQKMTVEQFDAIIASAGVDIGVTERMTMKNKALEVGVLEQGEIRRTGYAQ